MTTTDKPRQIIVCSKADYPALQRAIGQTEANDILVRPSDLVDDGKAYVFDARLLEPDPALWVVL